MKPVVLGLCLLLIFVAAIGSASLSDCPTCVFAYNPDGSLVTDNPYTGCPTCVFAYNPDGTLITDNPYIGCPSCVFSYDSSGTLITDTNTGCSSCGSFYGTTNTVGTCTSCSFLSSISPTAIVYTFPDGTPIPDDYLCPIHGLYCPDDPRPLSERPGYVAPTPTPALQTSFTPRTDLPETVVKSSGIFSRISSLPRSDRLTTYLNRVSRQAL
jgi:hypothetical protein